MQWLMAKTSIHLGRQQNRSSGVHVASWWCIVCILITGPTPGHDDTKDALSAITTSGFLLVIRLKSLPLCSSCCSTSHGVYEPATILETRKCSFVVVHGLLDSKCNLQRYSKWNAFDLTRC